MAGVIRLNPDEIRGMASQYLQKSSEVQTLTGELDKMAEHLLSIWEGTSSSAFNEQWHELRPSFVKMQELLADVNQQLNDIARVMQETDASIASQIRG